MGFEPTVRCRTAVFKTASLNHSDISPCGHSRYAVSNAYLLYQIYAVLSSPYANFFFFLYGNCTTGAFITTFIRSFFGISLYRNTFLLYNKTNINHLSDSLTHFCFSMQIFSRLFSDDVVQYKEIPVIEVIDLAHLGTSENRPPPPGAGAEILLSPWPVLAGSDS